MSTIWWVFDPRRRLALPVDMPRLDVDQAAERGWHMSGRFLVPNPPVFIKTTPAYYGYRVVEIRL